MAKAKTLDHILFWPVQLKGILFEDGAPDLDAWVRFFEQRRCWRRVDTLDRELGATDEQLLAEFVYFHPFVRSILFSKDGSGPLRILKRRDLAAVEFESKEGVQRRLRVRRLQLYLFNTQNAILTLEVEAQEPWPLSSVHPFLDSFRRLFRPYYDKFGGHVPKRVEWITEPGFETAPESEYLSEQSRVHTDWVKDKREPPVSAHWRWLLEPLMPWSQSTPRDQPAWRHLSDERLPAMTYLAIDDPCEVSDGEWMRLTFMDEGGDRATLPYSEAFMENFERLHCYDRFWDPQGRPGHGWMRTRYVCSGYHFLVAGAATDAFTTDAGTGLLFHFRHHYFNLGLFVHMQYGSLLVFLDRLYGALEQRAKSRRAFQRAIQEIQEDLVEFTAGLWCSEMTSQVQGRELYERWLEQVGIPKLMQELRTEMSLSHESLAGMESLDMNRIATKLAPFALALALFSTILTGAGGLLAGFHQWAGTWWYWSILAAEFAGLGLMCWLGMELIYDRRKLSSRFRRWLRKPADMRRPRIWVLAVNDLEAEEIAAVLDKAGEEVLRSGQPWGARWSGLEREIDQRIRGFVAKHANGDVFGIELAGPNEYGGINIDHHRYDGDDRWKRESSLEQVAKRLGIELDRRQRLIAANDRGYIQGMRAEGATEGEIREIRRRERERQNLTAEDAATAAAELARAEWRGARALVTCAARPTAEHSDQLFLGSRRCDEALFTSPDEWTYNGPRHMRLAEMKFEERHWTGGAAEHGYFGIERPGTDAQKKLLGFFWRDGD